MNNNVDLASLQRRLAALIYDAFLLITVLFAAAVPPTLLNGAAIEADGTMLSSIKQSAFILYLLVVWFLFYGWFWTRNGQTLGMTAWRIRAVNINGQVMNWRAAMIRWSCACLGLANISYLFFKNRLAWHERLSNTSTIIKPKA